MFISYKIQLQSKRKSVKVYPYDPNVANPLRITEKQTSICTVGHIEELVNREKDLTNIEKEKRHHKVRILNKIFDEVSTPRELWRDFDNTPREQDNCLSTRRKLTSTEELNDHNISPLN